MAAEHQQKAAELGFDVTKQFLTLALSGIAFVVGLSFSSPNVVSTILLWSTVGMFGGSAVLGLLFLMRGVNILSVHSSYDIYATSLRWLSGAQILLVLVGVSLLVPILYHRADGALGGTDARVIEIKVGEQSVRYPVESDKNYTIELDGSNVKCAASKQQPLKGP